VAETKPDLSYWLERYQPAAFTTTAKVPVLRAEREVAGRRVEFDYGKTYQESPN
jgi:hypothetical protein